MRYHNFDLWVDRKIEDGYPLRAASDLGLGEARGVLTLGPETLEINEGQRALAQGRIDRRLLVNFGTRLYHCLFSREPGEIESLFQSCWGIIQSRDDEGIRVRLRIEAPEIAALPWEFLYSPRTECFLGASIHTPLVRYLEIYEPVRELATKPPLRMLVLIPESPGLNAKNEKTNLLSALDGLEKYVQPTILEGNVTRGRIIDALLEDRFHILHFIGHGDFQYDQAFLLLNAEDNQADYVDHSVFAGFFLNHPTMKLVFLNSCKGAEVSSSRPLVGMAPQLVRRGIPAVIAMQYAIYDDVAILFAREFYRSLFKGWASGRVEVAVSHARNRLATEFPDERAIGTPVHFMRAREGVLFDLETGNPLRDTPFLRKQLHRSEAVARTHAQNISILGNLQQASFDPGVEKSITEEKKELAKLKQRLRFRNVSLVMAICIALFTFFLSWLQVFDRLPPEIKIESYAVWLGDLFTKKSFSEQIVIVPISKKTERSLGKAFDKSWRHEHAILVDRLSQAGVKVIAFDMFFPRDKPSSYDDQFATAVRHAQERGTSVIVGIRNLRGNKPDLIDEMAQAGVGWGVICMGRKWANSGYVAPLVVMKTSDRALRRVPSLAMKAVEAYRGVKVINVDRRNKQLQVLNPATTEMGTIQFSEVDEVKWFQRHCPAVGKNDVVANTIIDLSSLDILREQQPAYEEFIASTDPTSLQRLKGKIVLVGVENEGELFRTFRGLKTERRYGLELHADAVNTLLNRIVIVPLDGKWQLLLIICMGMLGALVRYWIPSRLPFWRTLVVTLILFTYLVLTIYIYGQYRILLNTFYHAAAFVFTYWVVGKVERGWF